MYLLLAIHIAWTLGAVPLVTRQKRLPASAAAWLALILLLPVAGTLLYVLAGYRPHLPAAERRAYRGDRLGQIIARGCGTRITRHNSVELLHNGNNAFTALIASLQRAVRSIHMEYYIIRDDRIGRTIAEILIRKARAGLEVRVIYDAVGSWRLSRTMLRRMHEAGVETAAFEPVRFPWFTTRVTRRNHRKIVVTDGKVAYLGGINIAKYYLDGDYMGKWRDEHLRIEGDAVKDLQRLFIADWARVTDECLDLRRYVAPHGIRQRLPIQLAWSEEGPSRLTIAEAFAAAVVRARQRVRICSPYFLPPTLILDALRLAARGGIRVEVLPAIAKRIGRHVEDAHDARAVKAELVLSAPPCLTIVRHEHPPKMPAPPRSGAGGGVALQLVFLLYPRTRARTQTRPRCRKKSAGRHLHPDRWEQDCKWPAYRR